MSTCRCSSSDAVAADDMCACPHHASGVVLMLEPLHRRTRGQSSTGHLAEGDSRLKPTEAMETTGAKGSLRSTRAFLTI